MWLISLVFSLTSALITSLNQQAVRRYIETPKVPSNPSDRARVRLLLFRGIKLYKMPLAILAAPTLLHLSILLFFGGLVIVFHTVYEKVAIALDVAVGVSGLVYMAMSLLPLLDFKCPYRTPITYLLWYLWHASLSFAAYCGLLFAKTLPGCSCLCPCPICLVPLNSGGSDVSAISDKPDGSDGSGSGNPYILLPSLSHSLGKAAEEQRRYLTDGIWKSVIKGATNPEEDEDRKTITWLFRHLSLGDKNKFLIFAASIPRHKVNHLIPPIKSGKIVVRQPLLVLLRSCTDDTGAVGPDEDVRKDALLVCLTAIHGIAKASSIPDLNFVRGEYANINRMRVLWNDRDDSIRITSRSICALVARQVIRKRRIHDADLSWLEEVTGEPPEAILEADDAIRDQMNFKSFVYGALPNHANHISTEDATSLNETLAILLGARTDNRFYFTTHDGQNRLSEEVRRIQQYDPEGGREVLGRLHPMFPSLSESAAPPVNVAPSIYLATPSIQSDAPSFYHGAPSFHVGVPFPHEVPIVHRRGPSSSAAPSPSAPRPSRTAHFSQTNRPPLVTPSPPGVLPPRSSSPPYVVPPARVPSPPYIIPPARAPSPPSAASPPDITSPPHAVPPSPVIPSAPAPRPHRATRPSLVTRPPLVTSSPQVVRAPPSQPEVSSPPGRAIPPPRAVFPTYIPPPRAFPSSGIGPPPSAPPTPRAASPSRTTRRSHTARPPHAPI